MKANLAPVLLLCLIAAGCGGGQEGAAAAAAVPPPAAEPPVAERPAPEPPPVQAKVGLEMGYRSEGCSFQYSPVDFCDERHLALIDEAIATRKPDFNRRYILLSIPEWPDYHQESVVAIDPAARKAYPVPIDAYSGPGGESGEPAARGKLTYALDSDRICIEGAILAYKVVKDGSFCFVLRDGRFTGYKTAYME
ncbi:hypothetical protein [Lysobacter enzymogenes]|uniref:hypothetical protein n=1 Tax=Lysobacter enzymogenes TaxID=69 RepID=UPI0018E922CB|nr:hypothetical protein [Lysobacter enzymogenes]UZW60214.1 hypothetical protein BV903_023545 [Lysobacter enzymogenes]